MTSRMEEEMPAADGNVLFLIKPSQTGGRKPLGVSFDELSNCSVQALGEGQN